MRALLSVYDKTGIAEFASALVDMGWEIISTGGTLEALQHGRCARNISCRGYRVSRNPRWPGQDAASKHSRCIARSTRSSGAP